MCNMLTSVLSLQAEQLAAFERKEAAVKAAKQATAARRPFVTSRSDVRFYGH
jgi:hypothetical protein